MISSRSMLALTVAAQYANAKPMIWLSDITHHTDADTDADTVELKHQETMERFWRETAPTLEDADTVELERQRTEERFWKDLEPIFADADTVALKRQETMETFWRETAPTLEDADTRELERQRTMEKFWHDTAPTFADADTVEFDRQRTIHQIWDLTATTFEDEKDEDDSFLVGQHYMLNPTLDAKFYFPMFRLTDEGTVDKGRTFGDANNDYFQILDLGKNAEVLFNDWTDNELNLLHRDVRTNDNGEIEIVYRERHSDPESEAQQVVPVKIPEEEKICYVRVSDITSNCVEITEDDATEIDLNAPAPRKMARRRLLKAEQSF